jgi:hypothetical protein
MRKLWSFPHPSPSLVAIPDSGEISAADMTSEPRGRVIEFGEKSKLEKVRVGYEDGGVGESSKVIHVFL